MNLYSYRAKNAYHQNAINFQTQGNLIVMLYEGAIRFIDTAIEEIEKKNFEKAHENIIKAERIISELSRTLDLSTGEISKQLLMMYDYMLCQLIQANISKNKDPERLLEVRGLLAEIKEAWEEIA